MLTFEKRNLDNIAKLADHTKAAALKWHAFLVANKIDVLIYSTIRTIDEQRANVKNGVSQTMKSYHIVGQALDFVPVVDGKPEWNGYSRPEAKKALAEAKKLGFEWGGDWKSFKDQPHLQFNHKGYGSDTFGEWTEPKPKVDKPAGPPNPNVTFKEGSKAKYVGYIQKVVGVKVDNDYGPKTTVAVKAWQKKHGLVADGIVGPKSWDKMF